jgi:hypothetical protein
MNDTADTTANPRRSPIPGAAPPFDSARAKEAALRAAMKRRSDAAELKELRALTAKRNAIEPMDAAGAVAEGWHALAAHLRRLTKVQLRTGVDWAHVTTSLIDVVERLEGRAARLGPGQPVINTTGTLARPDEALRGALYDAVRDHLAARGNVDATAGPAVDEQDDGGEA